MNDDNILITTYYEIQTGVKIGLQKVAVKATHYPSGLFVWEGEQRSQHKNREVAVENLKQLLKDKNIVSS